MYWEIVKQALQGKRFMPQISISKAYKHWITKADFKRCLKCKQKHGQIYLVEQTPWKKPPLHLNCRCRIVRMQTIKAGTATVQGINGADWVIKYTGQLPEYYVSREDAKKAGWNPKAGNLHEVLPKKMIGGDIYYNYDGHLPIAEGRTWYEADIHYEGGQRNSCRLLYSNDGLLFVSYDHYRTFYEIV